MPIDSLVSSIRHVLWEICVFQRSELSEGPHVWHSPKATPSFIPHNSQLSHLIEVSLSILKPIHGKLPFAYYLNLVAFSSYGQEASSTLEVLCQYQVYLGPFTNMIGVPGLTLGSLVLQALPKERCATTRESWCWWGLC
jgi:hypothetical protein